MTVKREVKEGYQLQGNDELIAYKITTTPWATGPTYSDCKAYDITDGARTDVSATILQGVGSAVGDVITTPTVKSLTVGKVYRIEVKFTSGGLTFEPYFIVKAEY